MLALGPILKRWPLYALILSAAMLAIAHGFQSFGGLAPCHLCLLQRDVYWVAMAVSALAVLATLTRLRAPAPRVASLLLALIFLVGAGIAGFHAGAEWRWWAAPASCATGVSASAADMKAFLAGAAAPAPACDRAAWVFLGLSMAGWNFLASLGLAGLSAAAALRKGPPA